MKRRAAAVPNAIPLGAGTVTVALADGAGVSKQFTVDLDDDNLPPD